MFVPNTMAMWSRRDGGRVPLVAPLLIVTSLRISAAVHFFGSPSRDVEARPSERMRAGKDGAQGINERVKAWFTVVESSLAGDGGQVNYSHPLECYPDSHYINLVVHIKNGNWSTVCGSATGMRGRPLAELLDKIAQRLPGADVQVPFGLHDAAVGMKKKENRVPVFAGAYHSRYASVTIPMAMGCNRTDVARFEYMNTPVVGWDNFVKKMYSCNNSVASVEKKAVFRGKAVGRTWKFGGCGRVCSLKDIGRFYVHSLGRQYPDMFDTRVTNIDSFNTSGEPMLAGEPPGEKQRALTFPEQLCQYKAVLNIGNNLDWAERLRQSFYGNAVILHPEFNAYEFFNSFMEPYVHYWPLKSDLSDVVEQVQRVLGLQNASRQVQGQRDFASTFLTEEFMLKYNIALIEEYERKVRSAEAGAWKAPTNAERITAMNLLKLTHSDQCKDHSKTCPEGQGLAKRTIASAPDSLDEEGLDLDEDPFDSY